MNKFLAINRVIGGCIGVLCVLFLQLGLLAGCTLETTSDDTDDSWTIFRGSPSLCGYTDRALPDNPTLQWCFQNNVRTVASPILYNGTAYTLDRKGVVRGIDANGELCFEYDLNTTVEASFIIRDSVMYIGQIDGFVAALSLKEKNVLWSYETEGQISASPNVIVKNGEQRILVGSYDSNMYTFNAATGEKKSQVETGYYINGAVALLGDYMVFGGCDAWMRVIHTQTGEATDSLELKAYVPASPAIFDDYAYISDYVGNVYEMYLADGKIQNHRMLVEVDKNSNEDGGSVSIPTVTSDAVFLLTGERYVTCLDRKTGAERWRKMLKGNVGESSPIACRDKLLVCTKDGHVSILNIKDGGELWHYEVGEQIISSPAVIKGAFYILTSRGKLFCFR